MPGWDVHTHLVPPTVLAAARDGSFGLALDGDTLVVDGARLPLAKLGDPGALLRWVDEQELDGAVVSVPPPLFRPGLSPDQAVAWAELVNLGLAELAGERLRVLGLVAAGAPVLPDGFAGVSIGTATGLAGLDPLWQLLDSRRAFVLIHPGHNPDPRLAPYYLTNLLGNPYETAIAVAELVFGDVIGRYPGISFCLCHGGGVTAAVAGRWQRGVETSRPGVPSIDVFAALRRCYVDDLVHDPALLRLVSETFGPERLLVGSDWPFPMGCDAVDPDRARDRAELTESLTIGSR